MNLLADENIDAAIVARLRNELHDVLWVGESEPGVDDEAILALARKEERLIITADKDFGELIYRKKLAASGVVLIRLSGLPPAAKASVVSLAFANHGEEMRCAFTVVSPGAARIRR